MAAAEVTRSNYIARKSITAPMGPEMQQGTGKAARLEVHESSRRVRSKFPAHEHCFFPCGKGFSLLYLAGLADTQQLSKNRFHPARNC